MSRKTEYSEDDLYRFARTRVEELNINQRLALEAFLGRFSGRTVQEEDMRMSAYHSASSGTVRNVRTDKKIRRDNNV